MSDVALAALKKLVFATAVLSDEDWEALAGIWKPFSAKRKVAHNERHLQQAKRNI